MEHHPQKHNNRLKRINKRSATRNQLRFKQRHTPNSNGVPNHLLHHNQKSAHGNRFCPNSKHCNHTNHNFRNLEHQKILRPKKKVLKTIPIPTKNE